MLPSPTKQVGSGPQYAAGKDWTTALRDGARCWSVSTVPPCGVSRLPWLPMLNKNLALGLGGLTGLVSLAAMVRLVSGAFDGGLSAFAWVITLLAMVPWVGYAAVRARHARLTPRNALTVGALDVVGVAVVWLFVIGPVVALTCSLAAFAVIWVKDWPTRPERGEDRFVRIEELTAEERD